MTLVNLTGAQRGVESDESGLNIRSYKVRAVNPKEFLKNKDGQTRGFAVDVDPHIEIELEGEQLGASAGLRAATFLTALTLANDKDLGGQSAGAVYLDDIEDSQGREDWRSFSLKASRYPLITS